MWVVGMSYWLHGAAEQIAEVLVQGSMQGCVFEVLSVHSNAVGMSMLVLVKPMPSVYPPRSTVLNASPKTSLITPTTHTPSLTTVTPLTSSHATLDHPPTDTSPQRSSSSTDALSVLSKVAASVSTTEESGPSGRSTPVCVFECDS